MDFQSLLQDNESPQNQAVEGFPSRDIQEIPQDGQAAIPQAPSVVQPTESERYWQSQYDQTVGKLKQYERWDPYLQKLETDPNFLQHSLEYFQGQGQDQGQQDAEPELDEIPTADQIRAHSRWSRQAHERSLNELKQGFDTMQQQAQVSQAMQRYATDYMRINPTSTAQEAYDYAQWVISPSNITPENLTMLFRAQRMGVNPTQASVMQRVQDNASRRIPGVTVSGTTQTGETEVSPEDQMKQNMLRMANRVMLSRQ